MTPTKDPARVRAEEALRATEERLRHLVEHAQDMIYYCDPLGRFTYVNPAASRVMEYEPQELVGVHFLKLIRPDHHARAGELYTRQLLQRIPNTYLEFPAVTKSGGTVWVGQHVQLVIDGGEIIGVQAIARDITRQKDAEDRLRRSEAKYRSLIQGAAYGIYRSTFDGEILDANPAFAQMLGYDSVEDVRTVRMGDVYRTATDRERVIARHMPDGQGSVEVEWKRKDGTPITVSLTARIVDFEADGLLCFEGMVEDITARRALEEQLRRAQKSEAVGILARGVAHDFNNVLAAILGGSDLMLAKMKPGNPLREDAEEIGKAAERGAALTRQLLAFSRRQATEAQLLALADVVRGFEGMLLRVVGGRAALRVHTPPPQPSVRVEPGQIEQVLMNLVVNARDAMPDGGDIDILVDTVDLDEDGARAYPNLPPGRYARLSVRDTGVGIPPDMQPHVFEPFFTTKEASKGTGLGLSIVQGIAKDAGGTVVFSSIPGKGTTFDVLIPLAIT